MVGITLGGEGRPVFVSEGLGLSCGSSRILDRGLTIMREVLGGALFPE